MKQSMELSVAALADLLVNGKVIDDDGYDEHRKRVEEEWLPQNGARLCAKAWTDPAFKKYLLSDGKGAAASLGFMMPEHHGSLVVKENTDTVHNVICCTLCSCTAFTIVGLAPHWYKNLEYRARIVREARSVLRELGLDLAENIDIRVWDTTTDTRYMILPMRPSHTEGWSEQELARLVTKESLIGIDRLDSATTAPQRR